MIDRIMSTELAIVFPGQGSQALGMLDNFISRNPGIVTAACEEASQALGYNIAALIANDEARLNQTTYTQPALLTAGVIAWRIWQAEGMPQPALVAGHSLGEFTALVCAGALKFVDGVKLVAKRGELMQQAVPAGVGAMAAILGLELAQVQELCSDQVQAANLNAPGQIVIAGTKVAVEIAIEKAKQLGAKRAILLPVSVPSHCALMQSAAEQFAHELAKVEWRAPSIPVIHNYDVSTHSNADEICLVLQKQLYNPVRWIETIEYFARQNVTEIVECGPGKVLTGLNKRIAPNVNALSIMDKAGVNV